MGRQQALVVGGDWVTWSGGLYHGHRSGAMGVTSLYGLLVGANERCIVSYFVWNGMGGCLLLGWLHLS